MVKRVFGRIDGVEVILSHVEGNRWSVPVPLDLDGEYVVEIIAEDEAGNQSFVARMIYTVEAGNICICKLPDNGYLFDRQEKSICFDRQEKIYLFNLVYPVCQGVCV